MNKSESIKNLAKALLNAQRKMGAAKKETANPYFKSKFADLSTVMEVVKGPLNDEGVLVLQPVTNRDGKSYVTTNLTHADSGEWMEADTEVVVSKQNDPQALGSAISYARRYGLQSMLFIPAVDDDSESAMDRATNTKPAYTKPTPTPTLTPALQNAISVQAKTIAQDNSTQTSQPLTQVEQITQTLEPLKKSGFRKKPVAPVENPPQANDTSLASDWN